VHVYLFQADIKSTAHNTLLKNENSMRTQNHKRKKGSNMFQNNLHKITHHYYDHQKNK